MKQTNCATLVELDAERVFVEANFLRGLPKFNVVGLASGDIQESKERVKSALVYSGFKLPTGAVTINLSPSDIPKNGSHFDLSIALIIALFQDENIDLSDFYIFGELGLDGNLKDTRAIFPIILSLKGQNKIKKVILPVDSVKKVSRIPNLEIYAVSSLSEAIDFLRGIIKIEPEKETSLNVNKLKINDSEYFFTRNFNLDFKEVLGQTVAKRASLIAVAGFHNIIYEGSPGSGKSMIAKRLQYILPPVNGEELLQIARFEALEGREPTFSAVRPFRSPHHTASRGSIFGGGSRVAKVGEVSMANSGILFFDELPHFPQQILEALREPLQDYAILVSRVQTKIKYPANFLFVGAMNPCPCGYLMSKYHSCRCSESEIKKYRNALSEPFWDRIDLYVAMQEVSADDQPTISSENLYSNILIAFEKQIKRGQKNLNGRLSDSELEEFVKLDRSALETLRTASEKFNLSLRSINKIKKVARTIADLNHNSYFNDEVSKGHILEALSYRRRK